MNIKHKEKTPETILTLVAALIVLALLKDWPVLIKAALILSIIGVLIKPLAHLIHHGWMWLAEKLGSISSKILLTIVFYLFLTPLALLSRLFNKDQFFLKNQEKTTFADRNHRYEEKDLKQTW